MSTRFVIPADADPSDQAFPDRPDTWADLAAQGGSDVICEPFGSPWCLEHRIDGYGFCTEQSGQPTDEGMV